MWDVGLHGMRVGGEKLIVIPGCSKKGNISRIAQQQHNTLLIGKLE
jgi:FKBP-type peptidyl-prolyl cis-trans isomerase